MEENPETEQENYNKSEMMHNNEISNIQYQEEDVTENKQTEPNKESIENEENSIENKGELNEKLLETKKLRMEMIFKINCLYQKMRRIGTNITKKTSQTEESG